MWKGVSVSYFLVTVWNIIFKHALFFVVHLTSPDKVKGVSLEDNFLTHPTKSIESKGVWERWFFKKSNLPWANKIVRGSATKVSTSKLHSINNIWYISRKIYYKYPIWSVILLVWHFFYSNLETLRIFKPTSSCHKKSQFLIRHSNRTKLHNQALQALCSNSSFGQFTWKWSAKMTITLAMHGEFHPASMVTTHLKWLGKK